MIFHVKTKTSVGRRLTTAAPTASVKTCLDRFVVNANTDTVRKTTLVVYGLKIANLVKQIPTVFNKMALVGVFAKTRTMLNVMIERIAV
ncbi:hypothetical protein RRG08_030518 [Elysia crispata]|uniref:Uncharacterized protein n=1 Tax=Elysia crispata TaxID=231223 RepID=A0AAE1EB31_9GAST|nr:hypothetical protein RRG08_030518 [Elysia crispata]